MKVQIIGITALISAALYAETPFQFTPQLLIETGANQRLDTSSAGSLFVEKMEAGFELTVGEKLTALTNIEYNAEDEGLELNEAKAVCAFSDALSLSAGKMVTNFGSFESEALADPMIKGPAETKRPAVQLDFAGDKLYGGVSVYNGILNGTFASFTPAAGITLDWLDAKLALRSEFVSDNLYSDISAAAKLSPSASFSLLAEFYAELNDKPNAEDSTAVSRLIGSMGEADFYPAEKWTIFTRFEHLKEQKSELLTLGVQAGGGFNILEQLRAALSGDLIGTRTGNADIHWVPSISAELKFEL